MEVLRSQNNSSYLVTGGFWSPHILSEDLFDQLISFVFADTGPRLRLQWEERHLNPKAAVERGAHWRLIFTVIVQNANKPTDFLVIDYKMADQHYKQSAYTDRQNTGT